MGVWWFGPRRTFLRPVASPLRLEDRSSLNLQISPLWSSADPTRPRPPVPGPASPAPLTRPLSLRLAAAARPPARHQSRPPCAWARGRELGAMWAGRVLHAALSGGPRGRRAQSALAQLRGILEEELEGIRGAGTWKSERVITSRQGPRIHVDGVSGGNCSSWESSDLAGG